MNSIYWIIQFIIFLFWSIYSIQFIEKIQFNWIKPSQTHFNWVSIMFKLNSFDLNGFHWAKLRLDQLNWSNLNPARSNFEHSLKSIELNSDSIWVWVGSIQLIIFNWAVFELDRFNWSNFNFAQWNSVELSEFDLNWIQNQLNWVGVGSIQLNWMYSVK